LKTHAWVLTTAVAVACAAAGPASILAMNSRGGSPMGESAQNQFPWDAEDALRLHEAALEKWMDGPTQLIALEDEKKLWKSLDTDDDRERFVRWFWQRRGEDPRGREASQKMAFYGRVGEANKLFTAIPRGWRTDRGRVWVVLGRPDNMRAEFGETRTEWLYYAGSGLERILAFHSDYGDLRIIFSRKPPRSYRIDGNLSPGIWPDYVLRIMQFVNEAMVVDDMLEFGEALGLDGS